MATTYDLPLVQGERFQRAFRYKVDTVAQDLSGYSWAAQARQKEQPDGDLLLDLTPYLDLDSGDDTTLVLDVPATVTANLDKARDSAAWDLFLWPTSTPADGFLLIQGAVTVDRASTDIAAAMA